MMSAMLHSHKTIFFDWNKTLSHSQFWEHLEDPDHPNSREGAVISNFLFNENRELLNPWMRGEMSTDDVLIKISEKTGISFQFIRQELEHSCRNMRLVADEIVDLIQKVRSAGIQCVIATDNMDTFRTYTIPHMRLDDIFDDFLISCELGVLKFDIDKGHKRIPFFDTYLSEHNLNYSDVVLLDDCTDDGFYHAMGFQIVQIRQPADLIACLLQ